MKQALNILIAYLTCTDPVIQNKWLNLLHSFWHKDSGWLLKSITTISGGYRFTVLDGDGNETPYDINIPTLPNSQPMSYIDGLELSLNTKVDKVVGKGLSTNDFTTALKNKLDGLQNYVHPDFHQISEIEGLQDLLDTFAVYDNLAEVAKTNDYNDLDNKPVFKAVQNEYADMAALYADQGNQTESLIQYVTDASAHTEIESGGAYFEYFGTTNGDETDYRLLSDVESSALANQIKNLSDLIDDIGATQPIISNTVFIDTVNGNDSTGIIENRGKPFKTEAAAVAAIPNNDVWTLYFIDGNVTRNITTESGTKNIIYYSISGGIFDFSGIGDNESADYQFRVNCPNAELVFGGGAKQFVIASSPGFSIQAKTITVTASPQNANFGIFAASTSNPKPSIFECEELNVSTGSRLFNAYCEVRVDTLNLTGWGGFGGGSNDATEQKNIFSVKNIVLIGGGEKVLFNTDAVGYFELGNVSGDGILEIYKSKSSNYTSTCYLNNSVLENEVRVFNNNYNIILSGNNLSGNYNLKLSKSGDLFNSVKDVYLKNFSGKISGANQVYGTNSEIVLESSNIQVPSYLIQIRAGSFTDYIASFKVIGYNSIFSDAGGTMIQNQDEPLTIENRGTLKTNYVAYGVRVFENQVTATFKEKLNEVVVRNKIDLINRTLDTDLTYIVDGEITLLAGEYIEVPAGGNLTINGYGLEASKITKAVGGESIFSSPVGGSGGLQMQGLKLDGGGLSSCFDLVDETGNNAIEINVVNLENFADLGELNDYRQFLGTTIGIYGCSDGLTLSGTWNGFKITNTNCFGFGASGTLFKEGTALLFNDRMYLDVNINLPTGAELVNLDNANFGSTGLLQINNTYAKLNSTVDASTNTPLLIPNIAPNDSKCLWANNLGITNTILMPSGINTGNLSAYADDTAAAGGGVEIGEVYINSSNGALQSRLT